jgi:phosphate transport system protein
VAELVINYISGQDVRHSDYALVEKAVQEANDRLAARHVTAMSATDFESSDSDEE